MSSKGGLTVDVTYVTSLSMARGKSGRIVADIDPALKKDLYMALASKNITLKSWIKEEARRLIEEESQPSLFKTPKQKNDVPEKRD